jgi:hypothetical protein
LGTNLFPKREKRRGVSLNIPEEEKRIRVFPFPNKKKGIFKGIFRVYLREFARLPFT